MFDIGFGELVLIFIVALVVLGPQRLPLVVHSVARFIRTARQMANGVQVELARELKMQEQKSGNPVSGADRAIYSEPVDERRRSAASQPVADQMPPDCDDKSQ